MHQAHAEVYGHESDPDAWKVPSITERIAIAHTSTEVVLQRIDHGLEEWYTPTASLSSASQPADFSQLMLEHKRQRFDEVCSAITNELIISLRDTPSVLLSAQQRISTHRDRFDMVVSQRSNEVNSRRDRLLDAAVMVYVYHTMNLPENVAHMFPNCTAGTAVSALQCALDLVHEHAGSDVILRGEVVEDLLYTDDIFQDYELHRHTKDFVITNSIQIHFFRMLSMLIGFDYSTSTAIKLITDEMDRILDERKASGGDIKSMENIKTTFLESAHNFLTIPAKLLPMVPPTPHRRNRSRLVRSIVGAMVGVTISVFMPAAAGAVLPSLSTFGTVVLTGATAATASAAINKDPKLLQAGVRGALLSAAAYGIGEALPMNSAAATSATTATTSTATAAAAAEGAAFSFTNAALRVGAEGAAGCAVYELTGGKCKHGLIQGAVSEVASSSRVLMGIESKILSSVMAGSASATSAWAMGGKWEEAFLQGVFIDQFNHAMHNLKQVVEAEPPPLPPVEEVLIVDLLSAKNAEQAASLLGTLVDSTLVIGKGDHYVVKIN